MLTQKQLNDLSYAVIGACIEVHKKLGPGLLEKVYQECLAIELEIRGIKFIREHFIDLDYKGREVNTRLKFDFLIENILVVEIKSVKEFEPIFDAQVISHMKLLEKPKGLLVNFNVANIWNDGQKTFVNKLFSGLPRGY